jgi:hypothetical protein
MKKKGELDSVPEAWPERENETENTSGNAKEDAE